MTSNDYSDSVSLRNELSDVPSNNTDQFMDGCTNTIPDRCQDISLFIVLSVMRYRSIGQKDEKGINPLFTNVKGFSSG